MITFYCTRCGCRLRVEHGLAGRIVLCGSCRASLRPPHTSATAPVAEVAEHAPRAIDMTPDLAAPADTIDESPSQESLAADASSPTESPAQPPPLPIPVLPLDYMRAYRPPVRVPQGESVETLAERLTRVEPANEKDASAMTTCPYCGSTIASFVGRCPYCRHPLRGS